MWGNIVTEVALQANFGIGFNNMQSDVLIHLTQWQYWWWFWFSFLWAFYYLIILRFIRFRTLKFRPKIATTFRPHGKWGDLIVCLIPVSWCANIITNSTMILKMIEWQAETGLITIRIRGKQWYWIYKFELKTFTDVLTIPKNIGRNKWQIITPGDSQISDDYIHILQLRSQNKWVKKYWNDFLQKFSFDKNFNIMIPKEQLRYEFYIKFNEVVNYNFFRDFSLSVNLYKDYLDIDHNFNYLSFEKYYVFDNIFDNFLIRLKNKKRFWENQVDLNKLKLIFKNNDKLYNFLKTNNRKIQIDTKFYLYNILCYNKNNKFFKNFYNYNDFIENNRWFKRSLGSNSPLRLIKYPLINKVNFDFSNSNLIELFRFRFNKNESIIKNKPISNSIFLTMKQKRYRRRKNIVSYIKYEKDLKGNNTKIIKWNTNPYLFNNDFIIENFGNSTKQYNLLKKGKNRFYNTSLVLSKRLLRTRRTLVLPVNLNMTVVTNSFDVIHSWYLPGLGLKMDAIPGRATHHSFYIDNVGFYYGQCAEICGRYHHHMPIRVCALPFEHFLLWWYNFGLPKLLFTSNRKYLSYYYGNKNFSW